MQENTNPLSQSEYDLISDAIYQLVKKYPFPEDVGPIPFYYIEGNEKENITVIPYNRNQFSKYKKVYVSGSFEGEITFDVAYKCFPTMDSQILFSERIVTDLMKWLEKVKDLPLLTDGRKITDIVTGGVIPAKEQNGGDGNMVFVCTATLTYFKKRNSI